MSTKIPDLRLYDAFYIENKPGEPLNLPKNCTGAIGITVDNHVNGIAHSALKVLNNLSLSRQDLSSQDDNFGIDLTEIMHAFVVMRKSDESSLDVCESVGSGITRTKIKNGDTDWTSMVLFIPKDVNIRKTIVANALNELKLSEKGSRASYAFVAGFTSLLFDEKIIQETHEQVLASEMADFLKRKGVRDGSGDPKEVVCSQLAMRILRAATLMATLPQEKTHKYERLDDKELKEKLIKKLKNTASSLAPVYQTSEIFKVRADIEALPYELYTSMVKNADIHRA